MSFYPLSALRQSRLKVMYVHIHSLSANLSRLARDMIIL